MRVCRLRLSERVKGTGTGTRQSTEEGARAQSSVPLFLCSHRSTVEWPAERPVALEIGLPKGLGAEQGPRSVREALRGLSGETDDGDPGRYGSGGKSREGAETRHGIRESAVAGKSWKIGGGGAAWEWGPGAGANPQNPQVKESKKPGPKNRENPGEKTRQKTRNGPAKLKDAVHLRRTFGLADPALEIVDRRPEIVDITLII